MEIRTLANTSIKEIANAFNEAFSDYAIKMEFTEEGMATKIKSENIVLPYSVGAFEGGKLIGFILHGYDLIDQVKTIYNAGTGVVPSFRGKGLTASLYSYIIPSLASEGINHHVLEVLETNKTAYNIYKKIGFTTVRELSAFKGTCEFQITPNLLIQPITRKQWKAAEAFMNFTPAWQNSSASIERSMNAHELIGAFTDGALAGYAVYAPATGRVRQFAVAPHQRRKGIGRTLFGDICTNSQTNYLTTMAIDEADHATIAFCKAIGLAKLLRLFEMKLVVK